MTKEMEKRSCIMREGSAVYGENQEEDEDVSMPRRNKIEIFVDENRMSPRWKKGRTISSVEKESAGEDEMYRGLRKKEREREKRHSSGKAFEVERIEDKKRDACCGRTEKEADRFPPFSLFSLSPRQKDREIRSLVPFPIW